MIVEHACFVPPKWLIPMTFGIAETGPFEHAKRGTSPCLRQVLHPFAHKDLATLGIEEGAAAFSLVLSRTSQSVAQDGPPVFGIFWETTRFKRKGHAAAVTPNRKRGLPIPTPKKCDDKKLHACCTKQTWSVGPGRRIMKSTTLASLM